MIEKLNYGWQAGGGYAEPTRERVCDKINELVAAVNELTNCVGQLGVEFTNPTPPENVRPDVESRPENMQDPFVEQRKWIGKLCKFWDYEDEEKWFSTLEHIDKNSPYPYCASGDWWYKHCEPVKPDDDIVYKDGDNEQR